MKFKNKRGSVLPRDIIFMILTFAGIIALAGIFVNQMGTEYGNVNMTTSYDNSDVGTTMLSSNANKWEEIGENLDGNIFQMLTGALTATAEILKQVLLAPATFGNMVGSLFESLGVEEVQGQWDIVDIIKVLVTSMIYIVVIFGIIKALLKGGDI